MFADDWEPFRKPSRDVCPSATAVIHLVACRVKHALNYLLVIRICTVGRPHACTAPTILFKANEMLAVRIRRAGLFASIHVSVYRLEKRGGLTRHVLSILIPA